MNWYLGSHPIDGVNIQENIRTYANDAAEAIEQWLNSEESSGFTEKQPEAWITKYPSFTTGWFHKGQFVKLGLVPYRTISPSSVTTETRTRTISREV
jgi:hypothetical protein